MQKRKYTKRNSGYWENIGKRGSPPPLVKPTLTSENLEDLAPESFLGPVFQSNASYTRTSPTNTTSSKSSKKFYESEYSNIEELSLPFSYNNNVADVKNSIELCQKAYFYVPIFRNTIDLMSEFANLDTYIEGGTDASRNFIKKWFETIGINAIKRQYFREYYRSGNVFLYRFFGKFSDEEMSAMKKIYASNVSLTDPSEYFKKNNLPIRYVLLNPADITCYSDLRSLSSFKKVLTKFEIQKLKNPKDPADIKLYKSLDEEAKRAIANGGNVYLDLEPERLMYSFYKKQDYEPMGIPFGFSVLDDINWKLELKKIDQCISKLVENIILLITAGTDPEKGGINPRNMQKLKEIFQNEGLGRVLVADYTTKAEFIIPDIAKIVGKEKYEIVNQDIKEGLQNVLFEDTKYANNEIKAKIFLDKLAEAREVFLELMQEEIKRVCGSIGFRDFPTLKFKETDLTTQESLQKAVIRLTELGIMHPELTVKTLATRELPEPEEVAKHQQRFKKEREDGLYVPLVGGVPLYAGAEGEMGAPTANIKPSAGRPSAKATVSKQALVEIAKEFSVFEQNSLAKIKEARKLKRLSKDQKSVIEEICESIVVSSDKSEWVSKFEDFINEKIKDNLQPKPEILEICAKYNVDIKSAAMIYHSDNHSQTIK